MIIFNQKLAIHKNGKRWVRGVINVPANVVSELGQKEQKLVVAVFRADEVLDLETVTHIFNKYAKLTNMEADLIEIKQAVMEGEYVDK